VSGAPRTPRHQGSVENQNKHIKAIFDKLISEYESIHPNSNVGWVDFVGAATSALNASVCNGNVGLTPYRHVFVQDYDFPFQIELKDRYNIRSVKALDDYVNNPKLSNAIIKAGFDIGKTFDSNLESDDESNIYFNPNFNKNHSKSDSTNIVASCNDSNNTSVRSTSIHTEVRSPNTTVASTSLNNDDDCNVLQNSTDLVSTRTSTSSSNALFDNEYGNQSPVNCSRPIEIEILTKDCTSSQHFPNESIIPSISKSNNDKINNLSKKCLCMECQSSTTIPASSKKRKKRKYLKPFMKVIQEDPFNRVLHDAPHRGFHFTLCEFSVSLQNVINNVIVDPNECFQIGGPTYYDYCWQNISRYWESDIISLFATLMAVETTTLH